MAKQKTLKKKLTKIIKSKKPILKSDDLPVTQAMLMAVQRQIKSSINSLEKRQDAKFSQIDARFSQIDARFSQIDARFSQIESKIELVLSEVHRMAVLMEEQNSRNRFVLDGYAALSDRQDRLELRFETHENEVENLILKRTKIVES